MKRRIISLFLIAFTLIPLLASCKKSEESSSNESTESTEQTELQEPGPTSPEGKVEWSLLGVEAKESFADKTQTKGNLVVVYIEAKNTSPVSEYISKRNLELNEDALAIENENMPKGYSNFGVSLDPGKRRIFALCFDMKKDWFKLVIDYKKGGKQEFSEILFGKDYTDSPAVNEGSTDYPLDSSTNEEYLSDFKLLQEKYIASQWNGSPNEDQVKQLTSTLKEWQGTYCYTDIDYNSTSKSAWDNVNHLIRLSHLINAYGKERLKTDEAARETVMKLLNYWLAKNYTASNWWYNEIQTPRYLAFIGLRIKEYLTDSQKEKMDAIIGKGTLKGSAKATTYTGANLTDMMATTILHGIFTDDYELLMAAVDRVAEEIVISDGKAEGMQTDGSYFQHGNLLSAAGSYGSVFVQGMQSFITMLHGTKFALPEAKIKLFIDHILDGQSYFHRGQGTAYFSIGRSVVYANGSGQLLSAATAFSQLEGFYRQDDLKQYVEAFTDFSKSVARSKFFPLAYTLISQSPEAFIGVRGAHESIVLTEVVNTQNTLGYNMSYGSNTCYMYYGDEYQAIGAVLDFSMFPGITAYHENDQTLMNRYTASYNKTWGKNTYKGTHCAGLTNDALGLGALYMELKNDGITGKLTYITYKDTLYALGADLNCSKSSNATEIRTSINQCKLDDPAVAGVAVEKNKKALTVSGKDVITNGAFAYYNLGEGNLILEAKTMQGSYSRTDSAGSTAIQSADVFSLYISHGTKLENTSYAYAVKANSKKDAPKSADEIGIAEIINTKDVQGIVFEDGHYAVVFHKAGSVTLKNGNTLTSDKADIIIK